jgi:hypothetical protein
MARLGQILPSRPKNPTLRAAHFSLQHHAWSISLHWPAGGAALSVTIARVLGIPLIALWVPCAGSFSLA